MSIVEPTTRAEELAGYLSGVSFDALPKPAIEKTKHVVLDCLGAMWSGTTLLPRRRLEVAFSALRHDGPCTVVGGAAADPFSALFVNSVAAHADETDDAHYASLSHPSMVTVPVALALGEMVGASGRDVITAVAAGYDAQCRVAIALGPRAMMTRGFMPLAVCANFGAVATAAVLLKLDPPQTQHALGLAGVQAGGIWACAEDQTHMAKAMMGAFGARNGATAALLAHGGYNGPPDVFEGRDGVLHAFSPEPHGEELTRELGERFEVARTSIKKHACGGPIQASVDALLGLMDDHSLAAGDIASIDVRIAESGRVIVDDRDDPPINLQHVLAVAAVDRVVGVVQTHSPERLDAPEVQSLRERVSLAGDDEFEKLWPGRRPAHVTIDTVDGGRYARLVEHAEGSPDNPMTWDGVVAKFRNLASDWRAAETIIGRVRGLEELDDVRALLTSALGRDHGG